MPAVEVVWGHNWIIFESEILLIGWVWDLSWVKDGSKIFDQSNWKGGGAFLDMEKITEEAGLGWGEDQLDIEIGIQRSMGWRYKFRSCQLICCVLRHNAGQDHGESECRYRREDNLRTKSSSTAWFRGEELRERSKQGSRKIRRGCVLKAKKDWFSAEPVLPWQGYWWGKWDEDWQLTLEAVSWWPW